MNVLAQALRNINWIIAPIRLNSYPIRDVAGSTYAG